MSTSGTGGGSCILHVVNNSGIKQFKLMKLQVDFYNKGQQALNVATKVKRADK